MKTTNLKSQVMKSAWKMYRRINGKLPFRECLQNAWLFCKRALKMTKVELKQAIDNLTSQNRFGDYNERIEVYTMELSTRETYHKPVIRVSVPSNEERKAIEFFYR